jgi:hypothetical protein
MIFFARACVCVCVCVCARVRAYYLPNNISYFQYLLDSYTSQCSQRADVTTTQCPTKPVTKPYSPNTICLLDFETTVNIYAFKGNAFVAVYTDDYDTPVSWGTRVKDFRGYVSEPHSNIIFCFLRRNMCSLSLLQ